VNAENRARAFRRIVGQNGLGDWAREELFVAQDRAAQERSLRLIPTPCLGFPILSTMASAPNIESEEACVNRRSD